MILRTRSIKTKLILISVLSSSIALFAFGLILVFYETTFVKTELVNNLKTQVEIITENSLASLAFMDNSTARKTLAALRHNSDVLYAGLYNPQGELLDAYHQENYPQQILLSVDKLRKLRYLQQTENFIQISYPVRLNGELLGYVILRANFDSFDKKLDDYFTIILLTFCFTLLIALILSSHLQRIISHPIIKIVKFIQYVTESKVYNHYPKKQSNDEIGYLVDAFNALLVELHSSLEQRDAAEHALSNYLNHLKEIVSERTLDLQKALKLADAANRSKSDFLANMSHEIRTPMNAIMGLTQLLRRTELTVKQQSYLDKIDMSEQLLLNIIDDILDFSKIEAGKLLIEKHPFSLTKLFNDLLDMLKFRAEQKNLQLIFDISPRLPPELMGDSLRLKQILLNLIGNAIKFTETGSIILNVTPKTIKENVWVSFSVTDTGIGITPDQMTGLFQSFSQADTSTTRKYGGTGLGLTICKQLVELMGGDISVSSTYGVGSTFCFKVLLTKIIKEPPAVQFTTNTVPYSSNSLQRILVVEDNEINQQVITELLTAIGTQVTVAKNGEEGVKRAIAETFDLILMDIQMPIMDGLTATRLIRTQEKLQHIPIVAMTAHAMQDAREKSLTAGMNDHLVKPIRIDKLEEILRRWLRIDSGVLSQNNEISPKIGGILPVELPPFNLSQALLFVNNNAPLLRKLLLSFQHRYVDTPRQLHTLITHQNFTEAEQLAHSLKGVAATLAAEELQQAASELERVLNEGHFDQLTELLTQLTQTLNVAITAVSSLPPLLEIENSNDSPLCGETLNKLLTQFHDELTTNNFEATKTFILVKPHFLQHGLRQSVNVLNNQLEQLDFSNALHTLKQICDLLKEEKP